MSSKFVLGVLHKPDPLKCLKSVLLLFSVIPTRSAPFFKKTSQSLIRDYYRSTQRKPKASISFISYLKRLKPPSKPQKGEKTKYLRKSNSTPFHSSLHFPSRTLQNLGFRVETYGLRRLRLLGEDGGGERRPRLE